MLDSASDAISPTLHELFPAVAAGLVLPGAPADTLPAAGGARELILVDSGAASDELAAALAIGAGNAEVVYLAPGEGLDRATDVLTGRSDLEAVHWIAHGRAGELQVGDRWLGADDLAAYGSWAAWQNALADDGDILIYGCDVAADPSAIDGSQPASLAETLARLTGADVAASDDPTGNARDGGDWELEAATGAIEAAPVLDERSGADYRGVLGTIRVTSTADTIDFTDPATDGVITLPEAFGLASGTLTTVILTADIVGPVGAGIADNIDLTPLGNATIALTDALVHDDTGDLAVSGNGVILNQTSIFVPAIRNDTANLTLDGVKIISIAAAEPAIDQLDGNLTFRNGEIEGGAPGIEVENGNLVVENSTISDSVDDGIYVEDGNAIVSNSTIANSNNNGIRVDNGDATISNSTIANNTGHGVLVNTGNLTVVHSTVTDNVGSPGLAVFVGVGNVANSIVTGNGGPADWAGTITSQGGNLVGNPGGVPAGPGDLFFVTDPLLGPLADNGGPTPTRALLPGSPAIDAANPAFALAVDQRGVSRAAGSAADIGAYEVEAPIPPEEPTLFGNLDVFDELAIALPDGTVEPVNFGLTGTGAPVDRLLVLQNSGLGDLRIADAIVPEGFALLEPTFPLTIAPGETRLLRLRLTAAAAGIYSGSFVLFTDAEQENPYNFPLFGIVRETFAASPFAIPVERQPVPPANLPTTVRPAPPSGGPVGGGPENDDFVGGPDPEILLGLGGDDNGSGGGGRDRLYGNQGRDYLDGGGDNDSILGGSGDDILLGQDGDDGLLGDVGADYLDGGAGADYLSGGAGNDYLDGATGSDRLQGDSGNDTLLGDGDRDTLFGGAGDDLMAGEADGDRLEGGAGEDSISGGAGDDRLFGQAGNDLIVGGSGSDLLSGGAGNDTLQGGADGDLLFGGAGDDLFVLVPGSGADTIADFIPGRDRFLLADGLALEALSLTADGAGNLLLTDERTGEVLAVFPANSPAIASIDLDPANFANVQ